MNDRLIADLTYRNYDGPLSPPSLRWWVVARQTMRVAMQRKGLRLLMGVTAWYYVTMLIILFFVEQVTGNSPGGQQAVEGYLNRVVWKDQFLHGFSYAQMPLLLIALLIGAGAIANDNRSRALLVYLSKPLSKGDYLAGKFVGLFLPILGIVGIPTLLFYIYGALSFRSYGFIADDPWILPKMGLVIVLSAALHAATILGVSSLFNQGRLAGAVYAGIYFLSNFFTILMKFQWFRSGTDHPVVGNLYYASIDGLQIGIAKSILGTRGSLPFGMQSQGRLQPYAPHWWIVVPIALLVGVFMLSLAWRRIRAVEVVG